MSIACAREYCWMSLNVPSDRRFAYSFLPPVEYITVRRAFFFAVFFATFFAAGFPDAFFLATFFFPLTFFAAFFFAIGVLLRAPAWAPRRASAANLPSRPAAVQVGHETRTRPGNPSITMTPAPLQPPRPDRRATLATRAVPGVALLALLAGCQPGRTYVLDAPAGVLAHPDPARAAGFRADIVLRQLPGSISLTPEQMEHFRTEIARRLATDPRLTIHTAPAGQEPTVGAVGPLYALDYRFVGLDPGNGPVRVGAAIVSLIGVPTGSLGQGALAVDVSMSGRDGADRVRFLCDGPIDGPGASVKSGLETAAESVAVYVQSRFPPVPTDAHSEATGTEGN